MTLHPGVRRGHHGPTSSAFGPDTGHDIPLRRRVHRRAAPAARALRHAPGLPPHPVHARRDGVVARARAAGRLLPVGLRRRAVVVPRRAGRDPALPRARSPRPRASPAPRASSTTRARSARSRPATTCRAASTPAVLAELVAEHRLDEDEAVEIAVDLVDRPPDRGVQAVSAGCRAPRPRPARAGPARAPRARQLLPRAPGLVHRRAPDATDWGIAAFTGRSAAARRRAHRPGRALHAGHARRRRRPLRRDRQPRARARRRRARRVAGLPSPRPTVRAVTITVTEAGYLRGADGGLDRDRPEVQADVEALRRDPTAPVRTAPARLLAGLAARRRADAGPIALVPCDNLPEQRRRRARGSCATSRSWSTRASPPGSRTSVAIVTTMVDRITPRTTPEDVARCRGHGLDDRCPVVTEPFSEWVLSGAFPGGRPRWEDAGATFTDDVEPFEQRKLWLLNGGHSLLAYAGLDPRPRRPWPTPSPTTTCRALAGAVVGRGVAAPDPAGRRPRGLPRGAARALREPAHARTAWTRSPPTARRSCRSGSCPCCGPSGPRGGCPTRPRACSPRGSATCAASARRSPTRAPTRWSRSPRGPEAVRRILDDLDPALAADDELVATVRDTV